MEPPVSQVLQLLAEKTRAMVPPMSILLTQDFGRDPFIILISCLLSLRARDTVVYPICKKLFSEARTPQDFLKISLPELEQRIKSIGFYRKKAAIIHVVCRQLIGEFDGVVPATEDELLSLYGVGRKTANLVLAEGFGIPALCVDTHVHKIANRLGLVKTKNPNETEKALQNIVPREQWREVNRLFVMWGQNICVPISPWCSLCVLRDICPRIGVKNSR